MLSEKIKYCLIFLLLCGNIFAQNISLTASVNNTTIAAGEQFQLTYSVNGNGTRFQAPTFRDFSVLMGPSQSMSTQIINGSFSQSISFTYVLIAQKEGAYEIGPASVEVDGKKYQSNALKITVVKGNPPASSQGNNQSNDALSSSGLDSRSVFIKAFVDRTNVLQGEAVTVSYKLCTKVNLVSYNILKLPSFTGFWSEDIPIQQQLQFSRQVIDGVTYNVADVKKVVLYPQRSGSLTVEPMEGEVIARIQTKRQQSNNPFDQFFNDPFFNNSIRDVKYPIKSEPVKINVSALPPAPTGCVFNGSVGKFSMEVTLDKKETKTNEAVTLKIKFSGKGNVKLVQAPEIKIPPDIESYDPKINDNIMLQANGANGTKTFEYLLIPRKAGEYKIPVDAFCYFDLAKKNYVQISSPEIVIKVARGTESGAATATGVSKEDVRMLGKDIRYIKTGKYNSASSDRLIFLSPAFFMLQAFPFAALLLLLITRRKYIQ
ncbi:MAG: protein BatD, partial [Bacteroidia bacterium]|nr:protein BatD [Bacteroidia bacterium]